MLRVQSTHESSNHLRHTRERNLTRNLQEKRAAAVTNDQGHPRERDRGKKSTVLGGAASSSPYQSPLALRKHGETPGHLDVRAGGGGGGGKGSGYGSGGEGVTRGGGRVGEGGGAPPSRPPPRAPGAAGGGKRKRWSAAEVEGERRGRDKESPLLVSCCGALKRRYICR